MRPKSLSRILMFGASLSVLAYGAIYQPAKPVRDPIATLMADIKAGKTELKYEPKHGYLKDLLAKLDIPWSSQMLVFSKTSMQGTHISPRKPRAIYFNDQVYVGWVNGGDLLEIASIDTEEGNHFYTLPNTKRPEIVFEKNPQDCVACHGGRNSRSAPALIIRSIYPDDEGYPVFTSGGRFTTPSVPLAERWGGWYVSGTHGKDRHMGNVLAKGEDVRTALDMEAGANVTDLRKLFDSTEYLTPHSDIMALMVAEHQIEFHNRAGRAVMAVKNMGLNVTKDRVGYIADSLVDTLLGANEIELKDPVKGSSTFASDFAKKGARDKKGRSLYDLDFTKRMFKYKLSPMVYSPVFEGLPSVVKEAVYDRLKLILAGQDKSGDFRFLTKEDRQAILEILTETKPDFAS